MKSSMGIVYLTKNGKGKEDMTETRLSRRDFFCALVATAVVAGAPLPIGLKKALKKPPKNNWVDSRRINMALY